MGDYTGIHHLAFVTGDMEATIRFWRDLLGMRLVHSHGGTGYRQYYFEISPNNLLTFFEWDGAEPVKPRRHGDPVRGPVLFDHISIGVESQERLWDLINRFVEAELPMTDVVDHGFFHSIYTFDPNGIPVEFSCDVAPHDVRTKPVLGDRDPSPTALEGVEPVLEHWPEPMEPIPDDERSILTGDGRELFVEGDLDPS
ncbi:MAG: VOC family protein [Magnetococcales bacterium]|nr:VOC family protein [Magnetococcales bacterium]